jgi:hypothetical protein
VSSVTLRPIMQRNYWRVEITWPDHRPRHFGKFRSRQKLRNGLKNIIG